MDKGSRQISIVTLGKGMALVVGCRALECRAVRAWRRDGGCYPQGRRLLTLLGAIKDADRIEGVGLERQLLGLRIWCVEVATSLRTDSTSFSCTINDRTRTIMDKGNPTG